VASILKRLIQCDGQRLNYLSALTRPFFFTIAEVDFIDKDTEFVVAQSICGVLIFGLEFGTTLSKGTHEGFRAA